MASIGRVGEPSIGTTWISVPATPASIDVVRSVAAVVAGHTSLGFDRVDDLRLAISEAAGRLIRAGGRVGSLRAAFTNTGDGLRIDLTLRDADVERWPIDAEADPLSWVVIEALADDAEESLLDDDPCISLLVRTR
jgi:hypothetical protein